MYAWTTEEKMDENYQNRAMMVTTVHIPVWLRQEIKNQNLTVNGALIRGWNALKKREDIDDLIKDRAEMKETIAKYQRAYVDAIQRIAALEGKK
jgi:hypothetical protein